MRTLHATNRIYRRRRIVNLVMLALSYVAVLFGLFWLICILWTLLSKGALGFSWHLLTDATPAPGEVGGLKNAIIGSLLVSFFAVLIGTPIGLLTGTYLAEYGQRGWLAPTVRFMNDILLSAPSIVIGLFIYVLFVQTQGHYSGWAGSLALAIIIIPVVIRTTDNMLLLIPNHVREAAFALGCPKWRMIVRICYKAAQSGILTGILLAIARILGETAPLLFTALSNQFMSWDMNAPMSTLPIIIYQFAASPFDNWNQLAWAGSALIAIFVLALNIIARTFFKNK